MLIQLLDHSQELLANILERLWPQNCRQIGHIIGVCKRLREFICRQEDLYCRLKHYRVMIVICSELSTMNFQYSKLHEWFETRTIRDFNGKLTVYDIWEWYKSDDVTAKIAYEDLRAISYGVNNKFILIFKEYDDRNDIFTIVMQYTPYGNIGNLFMSFVPIWMYKYYNNCAIKIYYPNKHNNYIIIGGNEKCPGESLKIINNEEHVSYFWPN